MEHSIISQINDYKSVIEEDPDDFIDFLYSTKIIDEDNYYQVWYEPKQHRISKLLDIVHYKENKDNVLKYLKNNYPSHEKELKEKRNLRLSLVRGDFPELPPNYVSRTSLVTNVKYKLQDLRYNQKLVIHGMMGYGKSCLINDVLRDEKVREYFDNYLFWINLGDCHSVDDLWQPMWRLYEVVSSVLEKKITPCSDDLDAIKDSLKKLFLEERLKNALIILNDVSDDKVLTKFDIKCKTVITTQNKRFFNTGSSEVTFVEVSTGFSATESLELFKKSLKVTDDALPLAAEEIHSICQGHPMLISLIGSYLNENAEEVRGGDNQIWQYIKEQILKGNYRLNEYNNEKDILQIIKQCIEKLLTDNLMYFYQDLAIFEQDVNIPNKVLQVLWNKSHSDVRNIMNTLAGKSLIVPFFHSDLKTYIYGIHEIYLNYLKDVTANHIKDLHRKLLAGYDRITGGNYLKLPNDNYTLQFIGYHIYHAEEFKRFQIYYDLKFLELKLKAVGKEDVIKDMNKYEVYITKGENVLKEKLKQYKDFIRRCGANLYTFNKTDIIQYALREKKDSYVFKDALKYANNSSNLYLQLQKPCEELDYSQIINTRDDITTACYVDSPQHYLIGTTNGKIKLLYEQSFKEITNFTGHDGRIQKLVVSPDKTHFLSVSLDGTVILWKFSADGKRNSLDFANQNPASPRTKQPLWQDIHTADRGEIRPRKQFKINEKDDYFISAAFNENFPDTFRIATSSKQGKVIIWDALNETTLYKTGRSGYPASCLLYMENEDRELVIFGRDGFIFKYQVVNEDLSYLSQLHNDEDCKFIFRYDNSLLAVSERFITHWEKEKKQVIFENKIDGKKNICSTLTNDQRYLVVSTNQKTVYIWDIEQKKMLREFENKGLPKSLDTFYDEDQSVHILLIGSDKRTLQQCHIQPRDREPQVEHMPLFTPYWKKKNVFTALASRDNRLQVFNGYLLISESEVLPSQITCTCFSVSGNVVIYGLKDGQIRTFEIRSKRETVLENSVNKPVTFLKCFNIRDISGTLKNTNLIVAVFDNNTVCVYNRQDVFKRKISNPVIFQYSKILLLVDSECQIFIWDVETNDFCSIKNPYILEPVTIGIATYCHHKSFIGIFYSQMNTNFFDIYHFDKDTSVLNKKHRLVMFNEKVKTATFSCDGSLLALGMNSGVIQVYDLEDNYKHISLELHEDPIEHLIFSPNKEPILVSLGEEIAWWSIKSFKSKERPKSLDILTDLPFDFDSMNISYWSERTPLEGNSYLLSFIKLKDKAKYLSAANDFNSFLSIDQTGKVYIMEIIAPVN